MGIKAATRPRVSDMLRASHRVTPGHTPTNRPRRLRRIPDAISEKHTHTSLATQRARARFSSTPLASYALSCLFSYCSAFTLLLLASVQSALLINVANAHVLF